MWDHCCVGSAPIAAFLNGIRDHHVIARIIARAADLAGNEGRAIIWFKHQPISGFGKTAEELVEQGQADAVMWTLEGMEQGVYA